MYARRIIPLAALVLVTACATPTMKEAQEKKAEREQQIDDGVDSLRDPEPGKTETKQGLFFGHKQVEIEEDPSADLPAALDKPIVISAQSPTTVSHISEMLSATYGVEMYITPNAQAYLAGGGRGGSGGGGGGSGASNPQPGDSGTAGSTSLGNSGGGGGGSNGGSVISSGSPGSSAETAYAFRLMHDGSVKRLLDRITSRTNTFWRWDNERERIVLYRHRTRTFVLETFAGSMEVESSVQDDPTEGGGSSRNASSIQKAAFSNNDVSIFKSVGTTIRSLASSDAEIRMSQTPPRITVQDTPYAIDRIATYIEGVNNDLGKTVLLNVQVLQVNDKDKSTQGIDWALNFDDGDTGLTSASGLFAGSTTPSSVTAKILDASSNFTNTEILLDALREKNDVSTLTESSAVTMNSMPVPVRVVTERGFVASTTTTATEGSSATEVQQETRMEGFQMTLLPRVVNSKRILLQLGLNLSGRLDLENFTSGDTTVQIPTQDQQNFLQRVSLEAGQTLVLSGYDSIFNSSSTQRGLSGWRDEGNLDDASTMILVTPHLLDS